MELSWTHEAYIFFGTIAGGFALGIVRDIFKSLKNGCGGKIIFVGISDIVLCVFLSLACFMLIYVLNSGQLRWYEIFGILIGFVIYLLTVSKYILALIDFLKDIVVKTVLFLISPFKAVIRLIKIPLKKVINIIKKLKKCAETVKNKQKLKFRQIKYIFKKI